MDKYEYKYKIYSPYLHSITILDLILQESTLVLFSSSCSI